MYIENPWVQALAGKNEHLFHDAAKLVQADPVKTFSYAKQVAALLPQLGGNHMFHPPAEQLHAFMLHGHTQLITDPTEQKVFAFAKADPWTVPAQGVNPNELNEISMFDALYRGLAQPVTIEIGSLFVLPEHQGKNWGKAMVIQMAIAAGQIYSGVPQISVVTTDNVQSLAVYNKIGWKIINRDESIQMFGLDVLEGWEPPSVIFLNPHSV